MIQTLLLVWFYLTGTPYYVIVEYDFIYYNYEIRYSDDKASIENEKWKKINYGYKNNFGIEINRFPVSSQIVQIRSNYK